MMLLPDEDANLAPSSDTPSAPSDSLFSSSEVRCNAIRALTSLLRGSPLNISHAKRFGAEGVLLDLLDFDAAAAEAGLAEEALRVIGVSSQQQQEDALLRKGSDMHRQEQRLMIAQAEPQADGMSQSSARSGAQRRMGRPPWTARKLA